MLSEISVVLRVWGPCKALWSWIRETLGKRAELQRRVSTLEAGFADCPADACPYCGKRAWRLRETVYTDREARHEVWACRECNKDQSRWVPTELTRQSHREA
jgi:hypothetical protein